MIDDPVGAQHILLLCSATDIVDNEGLSSAVFVIRADADVVEVGSGEFPYDDVTGAKGIAHPVPACREIGLDIFDPSVVDVGVEAVGIVEPFVEGGVGFFVFVYPLLQIDPKPPQGAHHDIGTDPFGDRDIPTGVFQTHIRWIIRHRPAHLSPRCIDEAINCPRHRKCYGQHEAYVYLLHDNTPR